MPAMDTIREAHRLLLYMQPDYCRANCPGGPNLTRDHEATCAEVSEWLVANPVVPPFGIPAGSPQVQTGPHASESSG